MDLGSGPSLQYDIAEQITQLLHCEVTIKSLRGVSREWKGLATKRVRHLRPRAGQKGGALDIAMLADRFQHVETLNLKSVSGLVRDECLASCSKMRHLRSIILDGCKHITNNGLKNIHTGIQCLSLKDCSQITWNGLIELTNLPNLTALNVGGIKLAAGPGAPIAGPADAAGHGHQHLQNAPAALVAPVHAGGGYAANAGAAASPSSGPVLYELLQRLESLTLGDHMSLSFIADRMVVEELAAVRPARLAHLDLSGCIDLTDWAIHELCVAIPSLTSLSLQSCVRLTNVSMMELGRLPRLRALNLRGCLQLNDAGLATGLSSLSTLEELNLQGCTSITGSCLSQLGPCRSLAVLNVSHCAAFSSLEPLRSLPGLQRLDVSHCNKLNPGRIAALTALSRLTEVRASHLRHHSAPVHVLARDPAAPLAAPPLALDQLSALASLEQLQALDMSYMSSQGGVPSGLLDAVAELTRLTRLNLAGCGGPGGPYDRGDDRSGLGFLSNLRRLQDLDLGAWQEVDPHELSCLANATALRRLVVSRLGNRHVNACFDGCDCGGSPSSSLFPSPFNSPSRGSPCSSAGSSPPFVSAEGVESSPLLEPAAVPAKAEARDALAVRARACGAAIDAAALLVPNSCMEGHRGSDGGSSASCSGSGSADCSQGSTSTEPSCYLATSPGDRSCYSAGGLSFKDSQMHVLSTEHGAAEICELLGSSGLQQQPSTACCLASASCSSGGGSTTTETDLINTVDALTRQMAVVGISCGGGACRDGRCACAGNGTSCAAAVLGLVAAAAAAAAVALPASMQTTANRSFESILAAVPPVAAPVPCLAEAATAWRDGPGLLPPMPMTPRPGLDGALGHLTGLTALAEIRLEACNHITDAGVARLALLPRLEYLDLGGCNRITGRTLSAFATHGSLQTLLLGNCANFTDSGLKAASTVGSLRVVDVSGCSRLTDVGAMSLGSLRRLVRLSLRSNSKCSDRTVEVLSSLPSLQWLCLSLCGVTDESLRMLATSRSLTWLDLSHCWRLSRTGVRQLEADRSQLKVIFSGRG
ncbi:hypothetical protein VaNZ11_003818 [Volvox africanus]|uniref:F-box/LRR-repeat protein 15-like leucin rich repeat domain-containing protein n=1 Tax=Volvox africanus TaxID=51714 RepID=A0ABQ5RWS4_9CHLO|nr:hypothetical protein VaNZ11_003818 [Volvox africanus]